MDQLLPVKPWWPMCRICGRVVDNLVMDDPSTTSERERKGFRRFTVYCHGQSERSVVGVWAAFELQSKGRRLPDAFTSQVDLVFAHSAAAESMTPKARALLESVKARYPTSPCTPVSKEPSAATPKSSAPAGEPSATEPA